VNRLQSDSGGGPPPELDGVRVTFLGGLGEIGRNCAAIEVGGQIALVDCGLMFPEEDMLGVDLVFPDWSWLAQRREDVRCVIITHAHEDHIGALPYFLRDIEVPVYGTQLSLEVARGRIEELGVEVDLRPMVELEWVEEGPLRFMLVAVTHSVPRGCAVVFDTDQGALVHSGDFKLDPTPIDGRVTDLRTFAELGRKGVRLLLSDSTNAERPGFVPSERSLAEPIRHIVERAPGRVVAACFSSHVHRVQQIADAGLAAGRDIAIFGRSMRRITGVGAELGELRIPADRQRDIADLGDLPDDRQMLITTGSQGEPFAALSLMASGRHKWIELRPDDTILISATPVPGNETAVSRVVSRLLRSGAAVFHGRNAEVHVSGHAARDELATFINVVRPSVMVPIHGEYRHLRAHAELAKTAGVPEVHVLEDGDSIVLRNGETTVERRAVPAGYVYLDGSEMGDVRDAVLRDRSHLADEGVVVVTLGVRLATGEIVLGPELDSHGFVTEPAQLLEAARVKVAETVAELVAAGPTDPSELQQAVRRTVSQFLKAETRRRPVVLPVVLEV
jgi:ribonuclease J